MLEARILIGDAIKRLKSLPDGIARTCVTSPPYFGLRDYGNDGQIGLEDTVGDYVEALCKVFDEVWRVLSEDGTLWLNLGDSYAGHIYESDGLKNKDLIGIPWRVAFALQSRGWYLRSDIIWHKPNPMPESVSDRPTKSHEYIFLMAKCKNYFYDLDAIREPLAESSIKRLGQDIDKQAGSSRANGGVKTNGPMRASGDIERGKNKRDVWTVPVKGFKEAHFATYPPALITPCISAGSQEGDYVLDPFTGSGTTGEVALLNGRNFVGTELNPDYGRIAYNRICNSAGVLGHVSIEGEN